MKCSEQAGSKSHFIFWAEFG